MKDVIIIGGGIFGCVIAKRLQRKGLNVSIIDNDEVQAGSKPAACLMKPSWCSAMGKEAYKIGLETLESLYEVQTIEFHTKATKTKVRWINPKEILFVEKARENVINLYWEESQWFVDTENEGYTSRYLIIAAGIWCNKLLQIAKLEPVPELSPMTGTSFKASGQVEVPKISVWMPYKQIVSFNINEQNIWIGDGTTNKNYQEQHLIKSQNRCGDFLKLPPSELHPFTGHRPSVKGANPCYLKEHASNLWVVTGGAKNGTIAAGWASHEISKRIQ